MTDCCDLEPVAPPADRRHCPVNGVTGRPVELPAIKALLTELALRRLTLVDYRFCAEPSCDVVYFGADGSTYLKRDLRVPVWQKEPFGHRMVCYCFGESERIIREELEASGRSGAVPRVRAHLAAGRCACEVRNPQGRCCLGDVAAAVTRVKRSLGGSTSTERGW